MRYSSGAEQVLDAAGGGPLGGGHFGEGIRGAGPGAKVAPVGDMHLKLAHIMDERPVENENPLRIL